MQEGSGVNAGDLLFKLDDSELQAELAQIESQIKLAEITKVRAASLLPEDAISQQEYDSAFSAHHLLQAQKNTQ